MKQISVMLKPASSACNLRCKYCFYADLAGKRDTFCFGSMSLETAEDILKNISRDLVPGDRLTLAFQGGEPTLVGLEWYRQFVELQKKYLEGIHVEYALQTNGTKLDDQWCQFLHDNRFLVGLSRYGPDPQQLPPGYRWKRHLQPGDGGCKGDAQASGGIQYSLHPDFGNCQTPQSDLELDHSE